MLLNPEWLQLLSFLIIWEVTLIGFFLLLNRLSPNYVDYLCKSPALDIVVGLFVWIPWLFSYRELSWTGVAVCVVTQILVFMIFSSLHSLYFEVFRKTQASVLRKALSEAVGSLRLLLGLWLTLLAAPVFLVVRFGQIFVYPLFRWVLGFPKYKSSEWIQISRHKFNGLVGLDLLACVYCEWAAGVYALGAEMVRNHESFWCPIRFRDDRHCENCSLEFPDLKKWVSPKASTKDAAEVIRKHYPKGGRSPRAWYGHSSRKA